MLPTNRQLPETNRIRLPTRTPGNIYNPFRVPTTNTVATPTRANRVVTTPTHKTAL